MPAARKRAMERKRIDMAKQAIKGLGVSPGARVGRAFRYAPVRLEEVPETKAEAGESEQELRKLQEAKEHCSRELEELVKQAKEKLGEGKAAILKGQISMLNDPAFYPLIVKQVQAGWSAGTAVRKVTEQTAALFENMKNAYMRERAADVRDVGTRLVKHLLNRKGGQLSDIDREVILVADDLAPSDTVQLDQRLVSGFVTRIGGKTSHTAIMANSLGIAAVVGAGAGVDLIEDGMLLALDGDSGLILLEPDEAETAASLAKRQEQEREKRELAAYANRPAVTKDGYRPEIAANIGSPAEAVGLPERGAEAVGLYRTEFLFMNRTAAPDEETQFRAYKEAAEAMQGRPVVIRTLDVGGDKELPYLNIPKEMNPFLGYRAIRVCLDRPELLVTQLRALLRASAYGQIKIMVPMISGLSEWRRFKSLFAEVRQQLTAANVPMAGRVETGIMVEIPAAAVQADRFAREVDFFSIGTNDLVQYTVAADRMNEKVAGLYDYFHPAVIRLVKRVIDASRERGIWTGMCGSMAGDPLAVPLLIGLGLHEFSMSPASLLAVKRRVGQLDQGECRALTERILDMDTPEEVRAALGEFASCLG